MLKTILTALALTATALTAHAEENLPWQHALSLYGDIKHPEGFTHFDYVNPNAPRGGILRQGVQGTFETFNSFSNTRDSAAEGIGILYESLLRTSSDESMTGYGLLASRMQIAEDRSFVVYEIRSEARWHDGKPVTAHDVAFTFEYLLSENAPPGYASYYGAIESIEELDERTVKFNFKKGSAREMPISVGTQGILPSHYWEECVGKGDPNAKNYVYTCDGRDLSRPVSIPPIGSGPYRVRIKGTSVFTGELIYDFAMGSHVTYERIPHHWGEDLPVNKGMFNFDALRFDYFSDADVLQSMFMNGVYDVRLENKAQNWAKKYEGERFDNMHILKERIETYTVEGMQGFIFNLRQERFQNLQLRQAMQYMMNFDEMNRSFFYSQYARKCSYFGNSPMMADGLPSDAEKQVLNELRAMHGSDAVNDAAFVEACRPVNIDSMSESDRQEIVFRLLEKAGYTYSDGAMRDSSGKQLTIDLLIVSPAFERIGLSVQKLMKNVGIKLTVSKIDSAQYGRRVYGGEFDMIVMSYGASSNPGPEQYNSWSTQAANTENSGNFMGLKNPAIDTMIDRIVASQTREELTFNTRILDRLLQSGSYAIPQWGITVDRVAFWNKFGYPQTKNGERPYMIGGSSFMTWWHDESLAQTVEGIMKSSPLESYTFLEDTAVEIMPVAPIGLNLKFWVIFASIFLLLLLTIRRWVRVAD